MRESFKANRHVFHLKGKKMSVVTNVILTFAVIEDADERMAEVNAFEGFAGGLGFNRRIQSRGDVDPINLYIGGGRNTEARIYIGAFNYLIVDEFIEHVRAANWKHPEHVRLYINEQDDEAFRERLSQRSELATEDALEEALSLLADAEWSGDEAQPMPCCPWCSAPAQEPHETDCRAAILLRANGWDMAIKKTPAEAIKDFLPRRTIISFASSDVPKEPGPVDRKWLKALLEALFVKHSEGPVIKEIPSEDAVGNDLGVYVEWPDMQGRKLHVQLCPYYNGYAFKILGLVAFKGTEGESEVVWCADLNCPEFVLPHDMSMLHPNTGMKIVHIAETLGCRIPFHKQAPCQSGAPACSGKVPA